MIWLSLDFLASILTDGWWWWDSRWWEGCACDPDEPSARSVFLKCISGLYLSTVFVNCISQVYFSSVFVNCICQLYLSTDQATGRGGGASRWLSGANLTPAAAAGTRCHFLAANPRFRQRCTCSLLVCDQEESGKRLICEVGAHIHFLLNFRQNFHQFWWFEFFIELSQKISPILVTFLVNWRNWWVFEWRKCHQFWWQ